MLTVANVDTFNAREGSRSRRLPPAEIGPGAAGWCVRSTTETYRVAGRCTDCCA